MSLSILERRSTVAALLVIIIVLGIAGILEREARLDQDERDRAVACIVKEVLQVSEQSAIERGTMTPERQRQFKDAFSKLPQECPAVVLRAPSPPERVGD